MSRQDNPTRNPEVDSDFACPEGRLSQCAALVLARHLPTRNLLIEALQTFGLGKAMASDTVAKALETIKAEKIDLLVADLAADRLAEFDLIRNALAVQPGLPVIVVSGFATIEWGVELMKAGVRDVMRKPLDVPAFREKVLAVLCGDQDLRLQPKAVGPYRIVREVERGGMGIIYDAREVNSGDRVALKVLPIAAQGSMNNILRFHREAEAIAKLDHPYIVSLKGSGFAGKRYYIAMEFIEGTALDILAYEGFLGWRRLAPIVVKILEAVEYAHDLNVLHRDLKPSNVLVDDEDDPHVIDFGLAQYMNDDVRLTKTGVVMGTVGYIAPERIRGGPATPACDVYSIGAIMYECLTRKIPYETESRVVSIPTSYDELVPLRDLVPDIPSELGAICEKALAAQPKSRYPNARRFREDLEGFLERLEGRKKPPLEAGH